MKFSIIVPVYNREKLIIQCIESISKQTYKNYEIIIIDDGSTDNTANIIEEKYKDKKNIKYYYQENSGPYNARLTGVMHSKGDYIMFVDSDDWIEEESLSTLNEYLKKYKADIIKYKFHKEGSKELQSVDKEINLFTKEKTKLYQKFIDSNDLNSLCDEVVKKELFENIKKIDGKIIQGEDALLNYELFTRANSILTIPNVLYHYIYSENSTSKAMDIERVKKCITSILVSYANKIEYIKKWKLDNQENKQKIANHFLDFLLSLVYRLVKSKKVESYEIRMALQEIYNNKTYNEIISYIGLKHIHNKKIIRRFLIKKLYKKNIKLFIFMSKIFKIFK